MDNISPDSKGYFYELNSYIGGFMKISRVLSALPLLLTLAACNSAQTPEDISSASDINNSSQQQSSNTADPVKVAQYLFSAGFTKEDAERVKSNLSYIIQAQDIKSQSAQNNYDQQNNDVLKSMNLIINGVLNKNDLQTQALTRTLIVNAANNISLNSLSNFQYYQAQSYLAFSTPYQLNYADDGCSAPDIFFVPNNVFYEACDQHDFGYRNGLFSELHNPSFKQSVDIRLYNNMIILCDRYQAGFPINQSCKTDAAAFYTAVVAPIVTSNWLALPSK